MHSASHCFLWASYFHNQALWLTWTPVACHYRRILDRVHAHFYPHLPRMDTQVVSSPVTSRWPERTCMKTSAGYHPTLRNCRQRPHGHAHFVSRLAASICTLPSALHQGSYMPTYHHHLVSLNFLIFLILKRVVV